MQVKHQNIRIFLVCFSELCFLCSALCVVEIHANRTASGHGGCMSFQLSHEITQKWSKMTLEVPPLTQKIYILRWLNVNPQTLHWNCIFRGFVYENMEYLMKLNGHTSMYLVYSGDFSVLYFRYFHLISLYSTFTFFSNILLSSYCLPLCWASMLL